MVEPAEDSDGRSLPVPPKIHRINMRTYRAIKIFIYCHIAADVMVAAYAARDSGNRDWWVYVLSLPVEFLAPVFGVGLIVGSVLALVLMYRGVFLNRRLLYLGIIEFCVVVANFYVLLPMVQ